MIEFSDEEKNVLVQKIKTYFEGELDQELGQFEAEFVLKFFAEEVGTYFYNRGLMDAQTILASRLDTIQDAIFELEKPTALIR